MKEWKIKPIKDTNQLLQYRNGTVKPLKFDYSEYQAMDPTTKVYWLITSGKDGSYIADNFVARHELPKYEDWPYTYATMALILNSHDIELPMQSIEDDKRFEDIAMQLAGTWQHAINEHVFDANNLLSIDPFEVLATIPEIATKPSKLKLAQFLLQIGSPRLHVALEDENKSLDQKLSLMKDIYDKSEAFLKAEAHYLVVDRTEF